MTPPITGPGSHAWLLAETTRLRSALEQKGIEEARLKRALNDALDGWLSLTNRTGIPAAVEEEHVQRIAKVRREWKLP